MTTEDLSKYLGIPRGRIKSTSPTMVVVIKKPAKFIRATIEFNGVVDELHAVLTLHQCS